jgi:toxin ParE1/3/4
VIVRRRQVFVADLTSAYSYLADRNPKAADRLLDEVEVTVELLATFPMLGRSRNALRRGVRSIRLRRFPFIVFYRVEDDAVVLLRVVHAARDHKRLRSG